MGIEAIESKICIVLLMNDDKNRKKVIVITGVTRGLGRAMAEKFIALGHTVLGCGRNRGLIDELRHKWPKRHDFDVVDVASNGQVHNWMARLHKKCGAPELVINNAGLINRNAPLWKVDPEEFSDVIDVNIKGVANVIRHFVPVMIDRGSGVVVNFSSGWGRSTDSEVAPYCATKWAIEGLTQALAQELPAGLAAIALNPGIINTDMLRSCFGGSASTYPSAEQWARKAVPFLLELGPKHNGQSLTVS